jgi:hypothetical protein
MGSSAAACVSKMALSYIEACAGGGCHGLA